MRIARFAAAAGSVVLALVPAGLAAQDDRSAVARKAGEVLKTHCYRCHGQNGSVEGGLNYLLDRERLVARKKVVPGEPDRSRLFQRVRNGEMPPEDEKPRPGKEEVALLKQWIEQGAVAFGPAVAPRQPLTPADMLRLMRADLEKRDEWDRRFTRYLTISHLANAGFGEDELQSYRHALAKLVNSLSWRRPITPPAAVDPGQTIFRIDLRDYQWNAKVWDLLLAGYPYGIVYPGEAARYVSSATDCPLPYVRADWFVAAASRPPLYHDLLQLPRTDRELEKLLLVDTAENLFGLRAARAGFNGSGVSRNNRVIERHESIYGAYWRSYDFAGNTGRQNVFTNPRGPGEAASLVQHEGGEIIFSLPNGLQGYFLVDGKGKRLDKAPTAIVSDPRRPDRAVENGISCMTCHARGIIEKDDQVREYVLKNPGTLAKKEADAVLALYPPAEKFQALQREDAERYRRAVERTGGKVGATEPVAALAQRFEAELDLPLAAAEAGVPPPALAEAVARSHLLARDLGTLRVASGTVKREVFAAVFPDVVAEMKLGEHLPLLAAPDVEFIVRVNLARGGQAIGRVRLGSIRLRTAAGEQEIDARKIRQILIGKDSDAVTTLDSGVVRGKILGELKVFTNLGVAVLGREQLASVFFQSAEASLPVPVPASGRLAPAAVVKLNAALPDLILSGDGKWLYLLNASEGKVQRLDTSKHTLDAAVVEVADGTEGLRMTPDGKRLYAFAAPLGHPVEGRPPAGKGPLGKVQSLDPAGLKVLDTFPIEIDPRDLQADDRGNLFLLGGTGQQAVLAVFDPEGRTLTARWGATWGGSTLRLAPDQRTLYFGTTGVSPANFHAVVVPAKVPGSQAESYRSPYHGDYPLGGMFHLTPDGRFLVATTGVVLRLAKNRGDDLKFLKQIEPHVALAADPDNSLLLLAGSDGTLKAYSYPDFRLRRTINLGVTAYRMAFNGASQTLYCAVTPEMRAAVPNGVGVGDLHVYPLGELLRGLKGDEDKQPEDPPASAPRKKPAGPAEEKEVGRPGRPVYALAFSPDGKGLAAGGGHAGDNALVGCDTATGQELLQFVGPRHGINSVAWSPDGRLVAAGCQDGTVWVWDARTARLRYQLAPYPEPVYAVAFSPDSTLLAAGGGSPTAGSAVWLWDTATADVVRRLGGHGGAVSCLAFSPDGKVLASGAMDATVRLWQTATGKPQQTFRNRGRVSAIAFSPDGKHLAWGDSVVHVHDRATGKALHNVGVSHIQPVHALAFTPDGKALALGGTGGGPFVFDLQTGQQVAYVSPPPALVRPDQLTAVAFSPDGKLLAACGATNGLIYLWDLTARKEPRLLGKR